MSRTNTAVRHFESDPAGTTVRPRLRVIEGGLSTKATGASRRVADVPVWQQLVIGAVMLLAVISFVLASSAQDAHARSQVAEALSHATYETVTVVSGDTLWSIALEHPVDGCTTKDLVNAIRDANGLESACLSCGMKLQVPVAG